VRFGFSCSAPGFVDLTRAGSAAGHSFADQWQRGALRPRPDGLKQFVDLVARCEGHADSERASGRVRACSRGLGQAADFAVAQAVVDEREDLASDRDGSFVLAAPLSDLVEVSREFAATVVADGAFDHRPAHEP
jgi:hypothetical protein